MARRVLPAVAPAVDEKTQQWSRDCYTEIRAIMDEDLVSEDLSACRIAPACFQWLKLHGVFFKRVQLPGDDYLGFWTPADPPEAKITEFSSFRDGDTPPPADELPPCRLEQMPDYAQAVTVFFEEYRRSDNNAINQQKRARQ